MAFDQVVKGLRDNTLESRNDQFENLVIALLIPMVSLPTRMRLPFAPSHCPSSLHITPGMPLILRQ
jgi:hypothetical protein